LLGAEPAGVFRDVEEEGVRVFEHEATDVHGLEGGREGGREGGVSFVVFP
jgi:hypothetical protein